MVTDDLELTPPKSEAWLESAKTSNKDVPDVGLCEKPDIDVKEENPEKSNLAISEIVSPEKPDLADSETVGNPEKPDSGDSETINELGDQLLSLEIHSPDELSGVTCLIVFLI